MNQSRSCSLVVNDNDKKIIYNFESFRRTSLLMKIMLFNGLIYKNKNIIESKLHND